MLRHMGRASSPRTRALRGGRITAPPSPVTSTTRPSGSGTVPHLRRPRRRTRHRRRASTIVLLPEMISYVYGQTASRKSDEDWFSGGYDDYATFLRFGSAGAYGQAMGMDQLPFWVRLTQHPAYDEYWRDQAVDRILARAPLTVPTLFVDSEWDQEDIYGAPAVFRRDQVAAPTPTSCSARGTTARPTARLMRSARSTGARTPASGFARNVMIPFLDQYLKDGPPAEHRQGHRVRGRHQPVAAARRLAAGLRPRLPGEPDPALPHARRRASASTRPPRAPSTPTSPTRPSRSPTASRPNLSPWAPGSTWRTWLVDDQRFAEGRPDVLTYSTAPLTAPLKLAGTPLVHLVASTSGTDSDWVVKLIDVYPDQFPQKPELGGYELAIAMDVMRARYRDDPARPPGPSPPTSRSPTNSRCRASIILQPGHRLMVQVQSSWFPLYDRNPQTFVPNIFFAKPRIIAPRPSSVFTGRRRHAGSACRS